MPSYALYHTLNKNVSDAKLKKPQIKKLLERFDEIDLKQKEAVAMLICEHAHITGGVDFDVENFTIPYEGYEDENGVTFAFENLPNALTQILYKFLVVG